MRADALRRVKELLDAGYVHIVDADLKSYFDTIPKDRLMARVGRKVTDGRILALVGSFLEQGVLDGELSRAHRGIRSPKRRTAAWRRRVSARVSARVPTLYAECVRHE